MMLTRTTFVVSIFTLALVTSGCDESATEDGEDTAAVDTLTDPDGRIDVDDATDDGNGTDTGERDTGTQGDTAVRPPLEAWSFTPRSGPVGGGATVEAVGQGLTVWTRVFIGDTEVTDVTLEDGNTMTFVTPPMNAGKYELRLDRGDAAVAFLEPFYVYHWPGPSGGPIGDTVQVQVSVQGVVPLEDAFVMLGTDPTTPHQGFTDANGQIRFTGVSGGPVTAVATAEGHTTDMIVDVDAQHIGLTLEPYPHEAPDPPTIDYPLISGELTGMDTLPRPGTDEVKLAVIQTSRRFRQANPDPGTSNSIYEDGPYALTTRTGLQAVVAFGGLYNSSSGAFEVHRFGVERGVFLSEGERASVDLTLDIAADSSIEVNLTTPSTEFGQDMWYSVQTELDLGHEGELSLYGNRVWLTDGRPLVDSLPPLRGAFEDATYSPYVELIPSSGDAVWGWMWRPGITTTSGSTRLWIPERARITEPAAGGTLQGRIEFTVDGSGGPDYWTVEIAQRDSRESFFTAVIPPDASGLTLPSFPDFTDEPPGRQADPYPHVDVHAGVNGYIYDWEIYEDLANYYNTLAESTPRWPDLQALSYGEPMPFSWQ